MDAETNNLIVPPEVAERLCRRSTPANFRVRMLVLNSPVDQKWRRIPIQTNNLIQFRNNLGNWFREKTKTLNLPFELSTSIVGDFVYFRWVPKSRS